MFHGGPYDGLLNTVIAVDGVPQELRLADLSSSESELQVPAHLYRLEGESVHEGARTTFVSYVYLAPIVSRLSLVDVWLLDTGERSDDVKS